MKHHAYDALCESLYELDKSQRENLLALLNSRVWLYESGESLRFEHFYEMDSHSLLVIVGEVGLETFARALKNVTPALKEHIKSLMVPGNVERLVSLMKELGPVRLSEAMDAETEILSVTHRLLEARKISYPPIVRAESVCRKRQMSTSDVLFCRQARILLMIGDHQLRHFLQTEEVSVLANLLGYVNHLRVTRKVLLNISVSRGEQLLEEIAERWTDYSDSNKNLQALGRSALISVIDRAGDWLVMWPLSSWWE